MTHGTTTQTTPSPAQAVRRKNRTNGSLITTQPADLLRHKGTVAYEDGYADAREYGKDGFFVPLEWNVADMEPVRLRYLSGFRAGLKVREARINY